MFNEHGVKLRGGAIIPVANVPSPAELERHGATVVNDPNERVLLDGHFCYSGEFPGSALLKKAAPITSAALAPMLPGNPTLF
jgi:7,8-dihydropterin-6-yl-methyl-4-(beta-D-ribofuranosyl)aminobenzene 5'-phosphate synthase